MAREDQFLEELWREKLAAQERRGTLTVRKLAWVTGLLALGAASLPGQLESSLVLYLVPLVAIVFDLYVIGEDYGIKRIGVYVGKTYSTTPDGSWELWLPPWRDPFARFALPLSTLIVFGGAAGLIGSTAPTQQTFALWALGNLIVILGVHATARARLAALDRLLDDRRAQLAGIAEGALKQGAGATSTLRTRPEDD